MPTQPLPDRPNLEQYRKQAKELVKRWSAGEDAAMARVREHLPQAAAASGAFTFVLADAQLVIAREHGFESWPKLAKQIAAITGRGTLSDARRRAHRAIADGDRETLESLLRDHGQALGYGSRQAAQIISDEQCFESWDAFAAWSAARAEADSPVATFEAAVEAIVAGDVTALQSLLRAHPDLVRARSPRTHHAMLLHYVGANGVEGFRQRTPPNIVDITRLLLDAGAEVNARAEMYGGSDTLGLVATSVHPLQAGVQDELMALLLDRGATIHGASGGSKSSSVINACLANGRPGAAEFFARRAADVLDLEAAAGVGALDRVRQYFDETGALQNATAQQLIDGFTWACEYGRAAVVDFLLRQGVDVNAKLKHHGQTGLHWAAYDGHDATCAVLLRHGASLAARDDAFDGTPLGWALYAWAGGGPHPGDERYYAVVSRLTAAGSVFDEAWMTKSDPAGVAKIRADARMMAALERR
jgi:hypothetical protein